MNPKAIAQVLFSLLENAGKYAPPATTIRVTAAPIGSGEIAVGVQDEGPGIPRDLRDRVFEKFYRGNNPDRLRAGASGLGLGLAIARGIIEAHSGRIWIEDSPEASPGTRFVFTIPEGSSFAAQRTGAARETA